MRAAATMKRVWSGSTLPDTTHFKNLLEHAGIGCFIKNSGLGGALGDLPIYDCSPELWVLHGEQAERAAALLRELVLPSGRAIGRSWRCSRCSSDNEPQFAACWCCGELDAEARD